MKEKKILKRKNSTDLNISSIALKVMPNNKQSAEAFYRVLISLYTRVTGDSLASLQSKTAQDIVQEICDYYENLIAAMPGNIYWVDKKSRFLGCNNNVARMLSLESREDIRGLSHYDVAEMANWQEGQADSFHRDDKEVIEKGKSKENVEEPPITDASGKQVIFLTTRVPLRDKQKKVIGVVGNSIDITELKQLQRDYADLQVREERLKVLSAVGGMIAHELRTPLASIKAAMIAFERALPILVAEYESNLADNRVKEPIRKDRLGGLKNLSADVKHYTDYSQSIISTILSCFKYTSSNKQKDMKPFLLDLCVKEALNYYPFTDKQQSLIDNQCVEPLLIVGDKNILIHTIQNLLKNALQSIDKANKGNVTISANSVGTKVLLVFRDTGSGISESVLPHIFEAFFTTKEKEAMSIGLGLYFCKMALQQMRATIRCDAELGKYAQFEIQLAQQQSG